MLSVKERHQMKRDNMSGFIYQYLQDKGFVDQSNTRTMSIPEVLKSLDDSQDLLPVIGLSVQCVSLRDLYYVFKKFNIKGRKTGRKIVESEKADTTPVDTDNCTNLESDHSEKSVSTVQVSEGAEEPEQMSPIEEDMKLWLNNDFDSCWMKRYNSKDIYRAEQIIQHYITSNNLDFKESMALTVANYLNLREPLSFVNKMVCRFAA